MKFVALFIAGVALAGCDITFGADGPVITQPDSTLSRLFPVATVTGSVSEAETTTSDAETTTAQATPTVAQAAPSAAPAEPNAPRSAFTLAGLMDTTARPLGVSRDDVDTFKSAVADEGCTIGTRDQRAAVQGQTGFDEDKTDSIISYLWRTGDVDRNSGNYQLTSGRCENG